MELARVLIWDLYDSKTTLEELRAHLPELPAGDVWISNAAQDRFGLISFGDEPTAEIQRIRELVGADPAVAEEFDIEER